jgi:hypothetical protein
MAYPAQPTKDQRMKLSNPYTAAKSAVIKYPLNVAILSLFASPQMALAAPWDSPASQALEYLTLGRSIMAAIIVAGALSSFVHHGKLSTTAAIKIFAGICSAASLLTIALLLTV